MKINNILITLMVLVTVLTGCMQDDFGIFRTNDQTKSTGSVITMTTNRLNGIINLSVDAPENIRTEIWIDLNGDGIRAEDGSEDISVFNSHQDYKLSPGLKVVSIYGGITYLGSASNELTAIDVSGNSYLTTLNVPLNRLTTLDISKNSALMRLDFSDNSITSIDISENRALVILWSFNNKLSELNLSNNQALSFLDCSGNQLNALDVSNNNELVRLICYNNQLTSLDISQNEKLNRLWIYGNPFSKDEAERITGMIKEGYNVDVWISDKDNFLQ